MNENTNGNIGDNKKEKKINTKRTVMDRSSVILRDEMLMPGKMFSLKQQISKITGWIILIIVLLLATLLLAMVSSYQKEQNEIHMTELADYADKLDEGIEQLNEAVGSIFSTNTSFQGLNAYSTVAEKVEHLYNLKSMLEIQVKTNKNISGLLAYYDTNVIMEKLGTSALYYMGDISFEGKNTIRQYFEIIADYTVNDYEMSVVLADEIPYYGVFLKASSAAVGGVLDLNLGLSGEVHPKASCGVIYEGVFYKTAGSVSELDTEVYSELVQGRNELKDAVVYMQKLNAADMAVIEILPKNIWLYINKIHILIAGLSIAFIFVLFKLYRFIYTELSTPLEDMTHALSQIQAGEWEVNFQAPNRIIEIENVRDTVQVMLKEIEDYKIRVYEEQMEKQETELQFLRLQLSPHFYTNCLKNAYYMLMLKEYENTERFLLNLSAHLRYLLQKNADMVTVQSEVDFTKNYIELQKQMNTMPLVCDFDVDESALDKEIPILAIQTFVENSVKHTRGKASDVLMIHVKIQYLEEGKEKYLDITVSDNGYGYPDELIQILNEKEPSQEHRLGVGVINLQSRIRLQCGSGASWYFANRNGAFSEIVLPVK